MVLHLLNMKILKKIQVSNLGVNSKKFKDVMKTVNNKSINSLNDEDIAIQLK